MKPYKVLEENMDELLFINCDRGKLSMIQKSRCNKKT